MMVAATDLGSEVLVMIAGDPCSQTVRLSVEQALSLCSKIESAVHKIRADE